MDKPAISSSLERYQRLIELSCDLASQLNLNELLFRIVAAAADLCDAEQASILLYDALKGELHFEAATNMDNPLMRGFAVPVENSIAGWIVTNREPVIIEDAQHDPRLYNSVGKAVQLSTRSLLGAPLITKGKVIGVLEAINKRSGVFNHEDVDLLAALGGQAAVAIENSRLFLQSDLIAELVHELRTPMSALNTAVHLLNRPDSPSDQTARLLRMIGDETNRLSELATAFLDLSRLESGRVQFKSGSVDIRHLITSCIEVIASRAAERGIQIQTNISAELTTIQGDSDKLKQVLLNLLSNAIKYNKENGRVTIEVIPYDGDLVISISDTGAGLNAEALGHLFERFYRAPGTEKIAAGTGLGLVICKRIIDVHRGRIEVSSQVGVGTTFSVHLPLQKAIPLKGM